MLIRPGNPHTRVHSPRKASVGLRRLALRSLHQRPQRQRHEFLHRQRRPEAAAAQLTELAPGRPPFGEAQQRRVLGRERRVPDSDWHGQARGFAPPPPIHDRAPQAPRHKALDHDAHDAQDHPAQLEPIAAIRLNVRHSFSASIGCRALQRGAPGRRQPPPTAPGSDRLRLTPIQTSVRLDYRLPYRL